MTNNKIQRPNDYLEVSKNQGKDMKTSSFCFGIFNEKPSIPPRMENPPFGLHLTSTSWKRRETIHLSALAGLWRAVSSPRIPKQAAFTPSRFQGGDKTRPKSSQTNQTLPAKIWNWKTQMNPNDNSRVFLRDQILGFDFYACMESAWTTVLASHKGLPASAPHSSLTNLGSDA